MSKKKCDPDSENFWLTIEEVVDNCELKPEEQNHIGNERIFKFAQMLQGSFPNMMEELSQEQIKTVLGIWCDKYYDKNVDRTGQPLTFFETWAVFLDVWLKVKYPRRETLRIAKNLARRRTNPVPEAIRYDGDKRLQKLVAVLYELQEIQGDDVIWVTVEEAGKILGKSATTASAILNMLVKDGVLELIEKYTTRTANKYKYIHTFTEDNEDNDDIDDTYDIEEKEG
jgi:predicted transcriptional regulator